VTALDHETTVLDALDFDVPCQDARCDDAAEWIATLRGLSCCVPTRLFCDAHMEDRLWKSRNCDGWVCVHHGLIAPTAECWIDAEPLNPR
jgi:hypothetical protein